MEECSSHLEKPMTEFLLMWRHASNLVSSRIARCLSSVTKLWSHAPRIYATVTFVAAASYCNSKETEDVQEISWMFNRSISSVFEESLSKSSRWIYGQSSEKMFD
jgi:hypothetical protein